MTTILTFVSCLLALLLLGVVALYLVLIHRELEAIGGSAASFLAKIRFGLRAIEIETGHLAPELTRLNQGLRSLDEGLRGVAAELDGVVSKLKGGRK